MHKTVYKELQITQTASFRNQNGDNWIYSRP